MTDEKNTPDPDDQNDDDVGEDGDENEGGEEQTLEEIKAERDEYKARLDRQRTQKAREARAAKRAGAKDKGKEDSDDSELQAELAAEREKSTKLEQRLNTEQATRIAAELGFKTPKIGVKALEWDELTDPSDPDEVRAELRAILKESPELKKTARSADGGEGGASGGSQQKTSFNDIIRRAAGRA